MNAWRLTLYIFLCKQGKTLKKMKKKKRKKQKNQKERNAKKEPLSQRINYVNLKTNSLEIII